MTVFERQTFIRFFFAFLRAFILLAWLMLVIIVPGSISTYHDIFDRQTILLTLAKYLVALEISLALAAPLGIVKTMLDLKAQGIMTSIFSAGFPLSRLRLHLLRNVIFIILLCALAFEATTRTIDILQPQAKVKVFEKDDVKICSLDYNPAQKTAQRLVLFRMDDLDISLAQASLWQEQDNAYHLSTPETLAGAAISLSTFPERENRRILFFLPSLSRWFTSSVKLNDILASLNRILMGGVLFLISAYFALLLPVSRQWIMYVCFPLLALFISVGMLFCLILLWPGRAIGYLVEIIWFAFLAASIFILDAALQRRGIRLD